MFFCFVFLFIREVVRRSGHHQAACRLSVVVLLKQVELHNRSVSQVNGAVSEAEARRLQGAITPYVYMQGDEWEWLSSTTETVFKQNKNGMNPVRQRDRFFFLPSVWAACVYKDTLNLLQRKIMVQINIAGPFIASKCNCRSQKCSHFPGMIKLGTITVETVWD